MFLDLGHELIVFLFRDPFKPLICLPLAWSFLALQSDQTTDTFFEAVFPQAFIFSPVSILEDAKAMPFVVYILALVPHLAFRSSENFIAYLYIVLSWPGKLTFSVHHVGFPATFVIFAAVPLVGTLAIKVVVHKITSVSGQARPDERTFALFVAVFVFSFVIRAIRPLFLAFAVLVVIEP